MTARAVSGGAVLRLRTVSPTFSPEKSKIGRVASSALMERTEYLGGLERGVLREKKGGLEAGEKMEEEKKERDGDGEVEVAIVDDEREKDRAMGL